MSEAGASFWALAPAFLLLTACVTARMHAQSELNDVGTQCGLALGELFQDEREKRLLFMMRNGATKDERACVVRWARQHNLRVVFVNVSNTPES